MPIRQILRCPSAAPLCPPWLALGLRAVVVLAGTFAVAVPAGPAFGDSPPVTTQPGGYVGSLLVPPGSRPEPAGLVGVAARCGGCEWTLEPACQSPRPTDWAICAGALYSCPAPALRLAVYLRRPGWPVARRVGSFCADPAVPLQPSALLPGVRDRFLRLVPALRPSFEPRGRGIVNLPVLFGAGQAGSLGRPSFGLAGHSIELEAAASWLWAFGDGATLATRSPGGGWPLTDVGHAFGRAGQFPVRVTTTWSGQFWVDGAGPFAVSGPAVTQTAVLDVPVAEARALLTGPSP